MSDGSESEQRYARADTLEGMLQRGRGLGAILATRDPEAAAEPVYGCVRYDWRWDPVDERHLYLARLIRDLELPPGPVVELLTGDEDACGRATRVLELLAKSGSTEAREALRASIREGGHWLDVLESVADCWPTEWWKDLAEVAYTRLDGDERLRVDSEAGATLRSLFGSVTPPHPPRRLSHVEVAPASRRLLAVLGELGERVVAEVPGLVLPTAAPIVDLVGGGDGGEVVGEPEQARELGAVAGRVQDGVEAVHRGGGRLHQQFTGLRTRVVGIAHHRGGRDGVQGCSTHGDHLQQKWNGLPVSMTPA